MSRDEKEGSENVRGVGGYGFCCERRGGYDLRGMSLWGTGISSMLRLIGWEKKFFFFFFFFFSFLFHFLQSAALQEGGATSRNDGVEAAAGHADAEEGGSIGVIRGGLWGVGWGVLA